jgi:hypothetical protein
LENPVLKLTPTRLTRPKHKLKLQTGLKCTHINPPGRSIAQDSGQRREQRAGAANHTSKVDNMAAVAPAGANEVDPRPNRHDPFWDGQEDILKSYSFNYEALTAYEQQLAFANLPALIAFFFIPIAYPLAVCFHCACDRDNIRDAVHARHVALTRDGIRYIVDKHPGGCRNAQGEVGRKSQTIPYDKINDCDVEEPAGADGCPCCAVKRTLYKFNVRTNNSTGRHARPPLKPEPTLCECCETPYAGLMGLDAPYELKKDV